VEHLSEGLLVIVGSTNPVKLAPVQAVLARAFPEARVLAVPAASGVPDQPIGAEQIRQGAEERARAALTHEAVPQEAVPQAARAAAGQVWGIGLEGGVIFEEELSWLTGAVAILSSDGRTALAWSPRVLLPPGVAQAVRAGQELGPVLDVLSGVKDSKTKQGAIGYLTHNLVPRGLSWEVAFACALAPFLHPKLYGGME
jgi:inosine/xanthosine triphosphatase